MTSMIISKVVDRVLTLQLNRPDALNAFRPEMLEQLASLLAEPPEEARVAVVEGVGRAFSAGVDLKVLQGIEPEAGKIGDLFDGPAAELARVIRSTPLPVIAKVHGFCFTGALEIALHCDMIFTTVDTRFGDTHAKFGLRPTWGMTQTLSQAVGVRRAKELSFTARTFTGADAVRWGLANQAVADKAELDELVAERAAEIAANSDGSIGAFKDLYNLAQDGLPIDDALHEELRREYPDITDTSARLGEFGS
jgi:enoyl-CoA hydratase